MPRSSSLHWFLCPCRSNILMQSYTSTGRAEVNVRVGIPRSNSCHHQSSPVTHSGKQVTRGRISMKPLSAFRHREEPAFCSAGVVVWTTKPDDHETPGYSSIILSCTQQPCQRQRLEELPPPLCFCCIVAARQLRFRYTVASGRTCTMDRGQLQQHLLRHCQ